MICFPNAKINLGLQIIDKRKDGFHNLNSIFFPVGWEDALEIIPSDIFEFSQSGIPIQGEAVENFCIKVYTFMKEQFQLPPVKIHLHKNIPIGAGLGGGSADGAFTLKMLNTLFSLGLSTTQMQEIIKPFGSDCAFFIKNTPTLAINKGDEFEKVDITLKGKFLVLIYPDLFISTKEAYSAVSPKKPSADIRSIIKNPISDWKTFLENDFEQHLLIKYPILSDIKNTLYNCGALYASMSGSGSTMYGIFDREIDLSKSFSKAYSLWQGWAKQ